MNLIKDKCIPVKIDDGTIAFVALYEISNLSIIDLASNRADFDCALYQLLIAFLQIFYSPKNNKERRNLFENPPLAEELKKVFAKYADHFELFSEVNTPAFMQELELAEGETNGIGNLLIEYPGQSTLEKNIDHFIKQDTVTGMCSSCTATALFTLQINAPEGGRGHLTGVRGGGPLTTLLKPHDSTLWQKLVINLLPKKITYNDLTEVLPWLKSFTFFNKSEVMKKNKKGKYEKKPVTFNTDDGISKLQVYWAMPRRIRLKHPCKSGICDICGTTTNKLVTHYITKPYGIDYYGPWEHPLSPHNLPSKKDGYPLPIKGKIGHVGIKDWLSLSFFDSHKSSNQKKCAQVVVNYNQDNKLTKKPVTLWCSSYDMASNKAKCYYNQEIPFVYIDDKDNRIEFVSVINDIIKATNEISKKLLTAIRQALFPPQKTKKKKRNLTMVEIEFYHLVDSKFYQTIKQIVSDLTENNSATKISKSFLSHIKDIALNVFNSLAMSSEPNSDDLKRIVIARNNLIKDINTAISKFK